MKLKTRLVQESFARCTLKGGFIDHFYQCFISRDPVLGELFANTDFALQKELLRKGLSMMILFGDDHPLAKESLEQIGESHSRDNLNIEPHLYPLWVEALMETVREFDSEFNEELDAHWRTVLNKGVEFICQAY